MNKRRLNESEYVDKVPNTSIKLYKPYGSPIISQWNKQKFKIGDKVYVKHTKGTGYIIDGPIANGEDMSQDWRGDVRTDIDGVQSLNSLKKINNESTKRQSSVKIFEGIINKVIKEELSMSINKKRRLKENTDGLLHAITSFISSGSIASYTGIKDYKTIDKIKSKMVSILKKEGDQQYSIDAAKKLAIRAAKEIKNNESRFSKTKRRISEAYGLHPDVIRQYLETALWSSNDESDESGGDPFDANYDISDIAPESVAQAKKDIDKFIDMAESAGVLDPYLDAFNGPSWGNLGHDFWLTRNGHGAGFWDRNEIDDEVGKKLTEISKKFGEVDPILGDDGKIYFE